MSFLGKKTPLWALLLSAIAASGAVTLGFMTIPSLSDASLSRKDFSVATTSSPLTIEQGSSASSTITVSSISDYNLATALTTSLSPPTSLLNLTLTSSVLTPSATTASTTTLTIIVQPSTPIGTYIVTVTGTGGTKSHTTTLTIIVVAVPNFSITPAPSSLMVSQNSYNSTTVTLTSIGGFAGNVNLTMTAPLAGLGVAGGPSPVHLSSGGTNTTILAVYATLVTPPGSYSIIVTGTSGDMVHTVSISVTVRAGTSCGPPMCGIEGLSLQNFAFNSTTVVTLDLLNTGSSNMTLVSYDVRDPAGDQWVLSAWNGPTIRPSETAVVSFSISSSCTNCTLVGAPFSFSSGNSYTILVISSRNNQFTYTVVYSSPMESLVVEVVAFASSTNATLWLRNTGSVSISLIAYYVTDTSGNQYAMTSWAGPTIPFNSTNMPVNFLIGSSCSSCTLTGNAFTFIPGNSYTITIVTARSNQFRFTIIR